MVLVLAVLVSVVTISGVTSYLVMGYLFERFAVSGLAALATSKQTALNNAFQRYTETLHACVSLAPLEAAFDEVVARESEPGPERALLRRYLRRWCIDHEDLGNLEIVDGAGDVIISVDESREGLNVKDTRIARRMEIALMVTSFEQDELFVHVSSPIRSREGKTVGMIVARFHGKEIQALTCDYTGLGETGETVLGCREGNEIMFLAPLRFAPDMHNLPSATAGGRTAGPMIRATAGQSGTIHASDYRDANVVAAYRPLENTGWGLVVKQDEEEAFAGVRLLGTMLFFALCTLLVLGISLIGPVVRRFTRPIGRLVEATDAVADGRLDVAVPETGQDEVGSLAQSFNRMVGRLAEAQGRLSLVNSELAAQADELVRANQEMEAFTYTVSHDLKTPLISIRGMFELLSNEIGDDISEDSRVYLDHINEEISRMGQLIQDLLEISRVGRMDTTPQWIESSAVVNKVVEESKTLANDREIEFIVAPNLPKIYCNERRFFQILENLVGNAVKFSTGTANARIEIGCDRQRANEIDEGKEEDVFYVRDNGPGIPSKDQAVVFELFRRLHGRDVPGTGMGLTLTRRILDSLGGWIRLESTPGDGATFYFAIPAKVFSPEDKD